MILKLISGGKAIQVLGTVKWFNVRNGYGFINRYLRNPGRGWNGCLPNWSMGLDTFPASSLPLPRHMVAMSSWCWLKVFNHSTDVGMTKPSPYLQGQQRVNDLGSWQIWLWSSQLVCVTFWFSLLPPLGQNVPAECASGRNPHSFPVSGSTHSTLITHLP